MIEKLECEELAEIPTKINEIIDAVSNTTKINEIIDAVNNINKWIDAILTRIDAIEEDDNK